MANPLYPLLAAGAGTGLGMLVVGNSYWLLFFCLVPLLLGFLLIPPGLDDETRYRLDVLDARAEAILANHDQPDKRAES